MSQGADVVRRFSRYYTRRIGVLSARYLGQDRPLAEARLLFEIGADGRGVHDLRDSLGLDSGYLARLLRSLERQGLIEVVAESRDRRARRASVTARGRTELGELDARSNDLAKELLAQLDATGRAELVGHLEAGYRLLRDSELTVNEVDPGSADLRRCLRAYAKELDQRFPEGYDVADLVGVDEIRHGGAALVAYVRGRAVGCAVLRPHEEDVAEVKHLWVDSTARGRGVGRRLLLASERAASEGGMRTVRLDTHSTLAEAIRLYETSGYHTIPSYGNNLHAHLWFEKRLDEVPA